MEEAERGLGGDDTRGGFCLFLFEESVAVAWTCSFPILFGVCLSILPKALCYLSPTPQLGGSGLRTRSSCSMAEETGHGVVRA